jgi:O-antigen ligase
MFLLLIQSILTFSRGGLYTAAGSFMLAAFFLIRDPRTLIKSIFGLTVFLLIVIYVLWPRLDAFTGGQLSARYLEEQRTSGRDTIVIADLEIWKAYPIYGVGPGMGKQYRIWLFNSSHPAHTEQTRMLAEHGLYGFVSLSMLLGMTIQRILRASTPAEKAFTASVTGFCLLYMLHAAMRLVTPSFVFGMAYATFLPEENLQQPSENKTEEQPQIASRGYAAQA